MRRHFNTLECGVAGVATLVGGAALLAACGSPGGPSTCESGRAISGLYAPFPGATAARSTWGGVLLHLINLRSSGAIGIVTGWQGSTSQWQWQDSLPNAPAQLEQKGDNLAVSVGNAQVGFSVRYIARAGSLACNMIPEVSFGPEPTEKFSAVRLYGVTPTWAPPGASETAPADGALPPLETIDYAREPEAA